MTPKLEFMTPKLEFMRLKWLAAAFDEADRRMDFNDPAGMGHDTTQPWPCNTVRYPIHWER